jgi:hypothetical protein
MLELLPTAPGTGEALDAGLMGRGDMPGDMEG